MNGRISYSRSVPGGPINAHPTFRIPHLKSSQALLTTERWSSFPAQDEGHIKAFLFCFCATRNYRVQYTNRKSLPQFTIKHGIYQSNAFNVVRSTGTYSRLRPVSGHLKQVLEIALR